MRPHAESLTEEHIKPAGKAAKDAVQQAQEQIPQPDESEKIATDNVGPAAKKAADAVKKNADPAAQKVNNRVGIF